MSGEAITDNPITDDRIMAYLGAVDPPYAHPPQFGNVTTWYGDPIGRYTITKTWRVPVRRGGWYEQSQVYVRLTDGRRYQGRSQGPGMIVFAKRIAADRRRS